MRSSLELLALAQRAAVAGLGGTAHALRLAASSNAATTSDPVRGYSWRGASLALCYKSSYNCWNATSTRLFSTPSWEELQTYLRSVPAAAKEHKTPAADAKNGQGGNSVSGQTAEAHSAQQPSQQVPFRPSSSRGFVKPGADAPQPAAGRPRPALRTAALPARQSPQNRKIEPHSLADAVWAFAAVRHHNDDLFREVARYAVKVSLDKLHPSAVSRFAWAYATMQTYNERLFHQLAQVALKKLRDFTPRHMADLAWAFAEVRHSDPALYRAVLQAVRRRLYEFHPMHLAAVLWALCEMGERDQQVLAAAEKVFITHATELDARALVQVLCACSAPASSRGPNAGGAQAPAPASTQLLDALEEQAAKVADKMSQADWAHVTGLYQEANHPAAQRLLAITPWTSKGENIEQPHAPKQQAAA